MEFYDVINARRTIRDFKDDSVDMDVIKRIIDSGMKAPDFHYEIMDSVV